MNDDDIFDDPDDPPVPPDLTVDIEDPEVIEYLYDHRGDVLATLLDRRIVPFGFQVPS